MNIKLKDIIKESAFGESDEPKRLSMEERNEVLEMVSNFNTYGKALNREGSLPDIAKSLATISERISNLVLTEQGDYMDDSTKKADMKEVQKISKEFSKIAQDAYNLEQRMTALYEDFGHKVGRYCEIKELEEGNIVYGADKEIDQTA